MLFRSYHAETRLTVTLVRESWRIHWHFYGVLIDILCWGHKQKYTVSLYCIFYFIFKYRFLTYFLLQLFRVWVILTTAVRYMAPGLISLTYFTSSVQFSSVQWKTVSTCSGMHIYAPAHLLAPVPANSPYGLCDVKQHWTWTESQSSKGSAVDESLVPPDCVFKRRIKSIISNNYRCPLYSAILWCTQTHVLQHFLSFTNINTNIIMTTNNM